MSFQCEELPDGSIALLGELDVNHARDAKAALCGFLARTGIGAINLSGITGIDFAGVQILLAAKQDAEARSGTLSFCQPSAVVGEAFELLGVDMAGSVQGPGHGS